MKNMNFSIWCKKINDVHQEHVNQLIKLKNKNLSKSQKSKLKKDMKITEKKEKMLEKIKVV